jgi:uncharacterized membrane protein
MFKDLKPLTHTKQQIIAGVVAILLLMILIILELSTGLKIISNRIIAFITIIVLVAFKIVLSKIGHKDKM